MIDTTTDTVATTITVGSLPVGVAVSPDGSTAYVTNNNDNSVSVITLTVSPTPPPPPAPAPTLTQVDVTSSNATSVFGQPVTFTAKLPESAAVRPAAAGRDTPTCGPVSWLIDSTAPAASAPTSRSGGVFTLGPISTLPVGQHPVTAVFPGCSTLPAGSGTVIQLVVKAVTTTKVTTSGSAVIATVAPVAPGAGSPTGTVTFRVGSQPAGSAPVASDGTAHLTSKHLGDQPVSATYSGDSDFLASSGDRGAIGPKVSAHLTSKHHKTKAGWYRSPVTVSFTCAPGSAKLAAPCPGPIRLSESKAAQAVTVTVTGADGGATTFTASPINIDRRKPALHVTGADNGHTYARTRHLTCAAHDGLSGIRSCRIRQHRHPDHGITTVQWTATASDRAGNTTRHRGHYQVRHT